MSASTYVQSLPQIVVLQREKKIMFRLRAIETTLIIYEYLCQCSGLVVSKQRRALS
jgi:hypothetical protein